MAEIQTQRKMRFFTHARIAQIAGVLCIASGSFSTEAGRWHGMSLNLPFKRREFPIERQKWFSSANYWLFPTELEEEALKKLLQFREPSPPDVTVYGGNFSKPLRIGTATPEEIGAYEKAVRLLGFEIYNAQPAWHLRDLHLNIPGDLLVAEFVNLTAKAARKFDWQTRLLFSCVNSSVRWREHGWKHVSYEALTDYWDQYYSGQLASEKAELIGSADEVRALIFAAANNDPEAVAKIWALFPTDQQQLHLVISYFGPDDEWPQIPNPADIGARLVKRIYDSPESEEAETSRRALRRLISPSVTKGENGERGRPKAKVPPVILRRLWKMSYCEVTQVREVSEFLKRKKIADETRSSTLLSLYPWIRKMVGEKPDDFVGLEPNKAALLMVGRLTGVGQSTLEKMGLRSRE